MSEEALVTVDVTVKGSDQHGRAFLPLRILRQTTDERLGILLSAHFVEDSDTERLRLIERALGQGAIAVETYPGEVPPHELHAYVIAPQVSDAPLFACVLAPIALVQHLVMEPPHIVVETATFQVIDGAVSPSSIVSAIESWVRRVWPHVGLPTVRLSQWPEEQVRKLQNLVSMVSDALADGRIFRAQTLAEQLIDPPGGGPLGEEVARARERARRAVHERTMGLGVGQPIPFPPTVDSSPFQSLFVGH
jgi:hypothetical protein